MVEKNFDTVFLGLDGQPQKEAEFVTDPATGKQVMRASEKDLTFRSIIMGVLMEPRLSEGKDANEKLDNFKLAMKIDKGGVQDVTAKQIVKIQEYVNKAHGPLVVGRMKEFLEGLSKEEE